MRPDELQCAISHRETTEASHVQRIVTRCQPDPMTYNVAALALGVALFTTAAPVESPCQARITTARVADGDSQIPVTAIGTRPPLLLLGVQAQPIAFRSQSEQRPKKGPWEFFLEFIDFSLKALSIMGVFGIIVGAVRLWFHDRAAARRRGDLRICPHCYAIVPKRTMSRCRHCRAELPPALHIETPPSRAAAARHQAARQESASRVQPEQSVRVAPIRGERSEVSVREEPLREVATRSEPARTERVRVEPIREARPKEPAREEPLGQEPEEGAPEERDQEEWEHIDDWEREEEVKRRKVFIYACVGAIVVGYLITAIIFLFLRF
jgi:hypothetical protein